MAARFGLALNSKTFAVIVWTTCDLRGKVFADLADMGLPGAGSLQYCMGQIGGTARCPGPLWTVDGWLCPSTPAEGRRLLGGSL